MVCLHARSFLPFLVVTVSPVVTCQSFISNAPMTLRTLPLIIVGMIGERMPPCERRVDIVTGSASFLTRKDASRAPRRGRRGADTWTAMLWSDNSEGRRARSPVLLALTWLPELPPVCNARPLDVHSTPRRRILCHSGHNATSSPTSAPPKHLHTLCSLCGLPHASMNAGMTFVLVENCVRTSVPRRCIRRGVGP